MPDRRTTPAALFLALQGRRLALRWVVMRYAILTAVLWTAALVVTSWLIHLGAAFVVILLAAAWLYFALPGIVLHALLLADLALYAVSGRTIIYPAMRVAGESLRATSGSDGVLEGSPQRQVTKSVHTWLSHAATAALPTVALATWALVVLDRAPASAHVTVPAHDKRDTGEAPAARGASNEVRRAIYTGRRLEQDMIDTIYDRSFAGV